MRRLALLLVVLFAACTPAVVAPSPTPAPTVEPTASATPIVTTAPATQPAPVVDKQSIQVPMPEVALSSQSFPIGTTPLPQRIPLSQVNANIVNGFAQNLTSFLDAARGGGNPKGNGGPLSDDLWNMRMYPGAFQTLARQVVAAKDPAGRFFYSDSFTIDAAWALPWTAPTGNGSASAMQFIDVTMKFRDHAETPPADGELSYTWHLRLPTQGQGVYAIADGYDDVHAKTWMNTATYWDRPRLEREATSALAGYLWNESYVKGGNQQFANVQDTTPFWHSRIEALNDLNVLFNAGRLTERHFENARVSIEGFEPLTVYGGGIVSITVSGRLVETLDGKTRRVDFSQPMKFFRFGASPIALSGWTAIDSFEDGAWVSGGNLALAQLSTVHG
jgi:hypothetical protein